MPFRRRNRSDSTDSRPPGEGAKPARRREACEPDAGTYLTDGRSLFRVQHAITEAEGLHLQEPLLELEDCKTLELILCSAGALDRLGLRPVTPSPDRRARRGRLIAS
jgi:hypothetical protein